MIEEKIGSLAMLLPFFAVIALVVVSLFLGL